MSGDEWGLNMESAARLESRNKELERRMSLSDREENDRRIPDGGVLFGRIRFRALSAKPGRLRNYGKQTQ